VFYALDALSVTVPTVWKHSRELQKLTSNQRKSSTGLIMSRLFVLCGQGSSLLWTPALKPYSGPVRYTSHTPTREMVGVCDVC